MQELLLNLPLHANARGRAFTTLSDSGYPLPVALAEHGQPLLVSVRLCKQGTFSVTPHLPHAAHAVKYSWHRNSLHCFPLMDYLSTPLQLCRTSGHIASPKQALLSPIFCLWLLRRLKRWWGSKCQVDKLHLQELPKAIKHKPVSSLFSTESPALAFCSVPSTCSCSQ